jgi:capsular polysaccharide biosynthesis protein
VSNPKLRWCGNALIGIGLVLLAWAIGLTAWPKSYSAKVRIKVEKETTRPENRAPFDPFWIQTEFEKFQSKAVLYRVITNLSLDKKWSMQCREPIDVPTAYVMLKRMMEVRQPPSSTLVEIEVRSHDPIEAPMIANDVASVFRGREGNRVEIVDAATAPGRPVFPSVRLATAIWFLALTSIGLGIVLKRKSSILLA